MKPLMLRVPSSKWVMKSTTVPFSVTSPSSTQAGAAEISHVGFKGIRKPVVHVPAPATVSTHRILAPTIQIVVTRVGVEGDDMIVRVLQANGSPVRVSTRGIVFQIGDERPEYTIAQLRRRIVVIDYGAVNGFVILGAGGTGDKDEQAKGDCCLFVAVHV